jgi:UPF0755 protein
MSYKRGNRVLRAIITITVIVCSILALLGAASYNMYFSQLKPRDAASTQKVIFTINSQDTVKEITQSLQDRQIIRSARAMEWYIRIKKLGGTIQSGRYSLSASQSVADIVNYFETGIVTREYFTIFPAQRIDQIRKSFIDAGYSAQEVDMALEPAQYGDHVVRYGLDATVSLEGYLYPDSYERVPTTTVKDIVTAALDELDKHYTPEIITAIKKQNLSLHQSIILGSVVEQEANNFVDRQRVAQVFLNRLAIGMSLGSDPTAFYGAIIAGEEPSVFYDTAYNTRIYTGLPTGPIGNVSASTIQALSNPDGSDYLYFVAGDDGVLYFSRTLDEHNKLIKQYCTVLCSQ